MRVWKLKLFPSGTVSADGSSVSITVELEDGRQRVLEVPFGQLDWLQQSLLRLAQGAYDGQVATGQIAAAVNAAEGETLAAENVRVMANTAAKNVLVQMSGRFAANAPLGMGSFLVDEELARDLPQRLAECAEQLRQSKHPS